MERQACLLKFIASVDRPLSAAPAGETNNEARVRLLSDVRTRCRLFDAAGLRIETENGRDTAHGHLLPWLEAELADARRDVKFERGDF